MSKSIHTKDKTMHVELFNQGMVEIESPVYKKVGIEVKKIDPTDGSEPKGALYRIDVYVPETKARPSEYDVAWVMSDGTIFQRKNRCRIGSP